MSDVVKDGSSHLIELLQGSGGGIAIPKPFERDIFLFDTHIAGTSFVEGMEELAPHLNLEERLDFFREPDNPYDPAAIVIKNANGIKLGYVPRADNAIFSRLMDAGKLLFARISGRELQGNWWKIDIKVFLHE